MPRGAPSKLHMHSGLTRLVPQHSTIKIHEGHGSATGPVEPRPTGVGDSKLPVHPCHGRAAITTRLRRGRFSSAMFREHSMLLSIKLAGSDASRARYAVVQKNQDGSLRASLFSATGCRNRPPSSTSGRLSGSHHGRICPAQVSAVRACRWIRLDRGCLPASAGPCIIHGPRQTDPHPPAIP